MRHGVAVEQPAHIALADDGALWPAGRSGGVDDIGEVLRLRAGGEIVLRLLGDRGPVGVEAQRLGCVGQALAQRLRGSTSSGAASSIIKARRSRG